MARPPIVESQHGEDRIMYLVSTWYVLDARLGASRAFPNLSLTSL